MTPSQDDPRTPSVQAADGLRQDIEAGQYAPGTKLPTLKELSKHFGIAGQTVQNALRILREEGLIFSVPNRGYFVTESGSPAPTDSDGDVRKEIKEIRSEVRRLAARVAELEEHSAPSSG